MTEVATRIAAAATLVWLGMVLAISFLEAPLKFRAPGLSLQVGLGIGRLVFRALNAVELVLLAALAIALIAHPQGWTIGALAIAAGVLLAVQLGLVRPWLNRRSDRVLAGSTPADAPRSRAHLVYVVLELAKVVLLAALACYLLAA